jgi:adenine-specific DNA-methyltransferase
MEWGLTGPALMQAQAGGFVRAIPANGNQPFTISYLTAPNIHKIADGRLQIVGVRPDGSKIVVAAEGSLSRPRTVWNVTSHSAGDYGTKMLNGMLGGRSFPFPKSVYAVEDALRFFVKDKPDGVILDFFAGSGTTAHAVMRLNRQDGGRRQSILVTNNEVAADEQKALRKQGLRPGDAEWERWGICDYITKPRIEAAITGRTPSGELIKGDYKFTDEFPMSDGFEENAAFFTLTYESPLSVAHDRAFAKIAPLLWLRAGSAGRIICDLGERGWDIAERYAVLENLDNAADFIGSLTDAEDLRLAFIVTDDESAFQLVCQDLPAHVSPIRLYESYLQNFRISPGRMS